jgi:hypothetical protein
MPKFIVIVDCIVAASDEDDAMQEVLRLLNTNLPGVKWRAQQAVHFPSSVRHSRYDCSHCKGSGNEPEAGFSDSPCQVCQGTGKKPKRVLTRVRK